MSNTSGNNNGKESFYKGSILILTFMSYMCYHLSRRPLSIVKSVLTPNCSSLHPSSEVIITNATRNTWCDWEPFDSNAVLGAMDSCFLFSYAFFMFGSGFVAERCHLRYFLALGMIGSGIFTYLFGIAFYYDIHNIYYFITIQILCGAFQTTGWPAVVAAVSNWFGPRSSRGLIFGIWNSHTSIGNMLGAYVSGTFVAYNWGLSFIASAIFIAVGGFIIFLFLVPYPEEVGLHPVGSRDESVTQSLEESGSINEESVDNANVAAGHRRRMIRAESFSNRNNSHDEESPLMSDDSGAEVKVASGGAVSFFSAFGIPGVLEFSVSLFFSKLVCYTFLYWLPKYIKDTTSFNEEDSAYLSMPFDMGGIVGSIAAGYVADRTGASGLTCIVMLFFTLPMLFVYQLFGTMTTMSNIVLQALLGILVNGPYCLITTAVAADLGNQVTNAKALATVTAIIDGTGSIGAAVGPLLAGLVQSYSSWKNVFYMIMISDVISMLLLLRIGRNEIRKWRRAP